MSVLTTYRNIMSCYTQLNVSSCPGRSDEGVREVPHPSMSCLSEIVDKEISSVNILRLENNI